MSHRQCLCVALLLQGVFCNWVPSNLFSLVQALVFKAPAVRRACNLPPLAGMQATASGLPVVTPGQPIETLTKPPSHSCARKKPKAA